METEKPNEASLVVADSVDSNEAGPTRRELLVRGSKGLLPCLATWELSRVNPMEWVSQQ